MNPTTDRRRFLKVSGVSLALPLLDGFAPTSGAAAVKDEPPRRMVFICSSLGFHGANVIPDQTGGDYVAPAYLEILKEHRNEFTIFSGLSHPDQAGRSGHSSEKTWLTSAPHPGLSGFRNTISVDQLAAEKLGYVTRFPSLVLGTSASSQSYTRSGVMIPANASPSKVFAKLFLKGTDKEIQQQIQKLRDGRSILDTVADEARRLTKRSSTADKERLGEYFQSVRDLENRLTQAESWANKPKPAVDAQPPDDISNASDLIGRMTLMFELVPLALQTDSTRVMTVLVQGRNDVPVVSGVTVDHHNLSHHGQDPDKLKQLELIETAQFQAFNELLASLKAKDESGRRLIDSTSVVFGSNLGNANNHDWRNLPILLAGGGYKHGKHVAFDKDNNTPLGNLFLTLLQEQGIDVGQFGSSTGTLSLSS